jgi:GAF domain-containing protein
VTGDDRVSKVEAAFATRSTAPGSLCSASAELLHVSSVGVTLMSGQHSGPVCHSDDRAKTLDELQFSLGEGPCPDAFASREPVFEPDLGNAQVARWPSFTASALSLDTHGVFALPLTAGSRCVGVLTLYNTTAGALTSDQVADGLAVAHAVTRSMLAAQARSKPDVLSDALDDTSAHRAEVHQASGMVAVQLGLRIADAEARLRAYAYATDRSVADVARDVVERRLRLIDDERGSGDRG